MGKGVRRGHIPLRFENMWLKAEGFKDLLRANWESFVVTGSYSYIVAEKLKKIEGCAEEME